MLKRIGILGHPLRPETGEVGEQVARSLRERNIDIWQRSSWDETSIRSLIAESDMVVAIGGDGSMLRAARICAKASVPVFGINTGHLGFLTEVSPSGWDEALDALLAGNYWIEQRMMVYAEAWRGDVCLRHDHALNDVVISRGARARSVILETYIDGVWTTTYHADGLIVSTPTGSTAYALAANGPILPPELENILVVPVAAHLSFDRALVLDQGATVEVVVAPDTRADVELNVDGERVASLENGDAVIVQSSDYRGQFVRLRDRHYFYRSILDRMEPRIPVRREPDRRSRPIDARRPT